MLMSDEESIEKLFEMVEKGALPGQVPPPERGGL